MVFLIPRFCKGGICLKIGIDLGGSHIAVGIITEKGRIIQKEEQNIIYSKEREDIKQIIFNKILSLTNSVLKSSQVPIFVIEEIGIGVPGIIENNIVKKCDKYKIYNWDLAKILEEYYQIPVKLQNDALCAAKAEKEYGNLKEGKRGVFICFGTGIGGATIIKEEVIPSEFGHMVIEKDGNLCNCGKRGCFETYSSMNAFKNKIIEVLGINVDATSEDILKFLIKNKDDESANKYIDEYINTLCIGLSNIINIINPEQICIGGSFTYFEDILYKRLLEKVQLISYQFDKPKIVLAKLKNDAGIIGAIL